MNLTNQAQQLSQLFGQPQQQMAPAGEIVWVQNAEQLNALQLPPSSSRIYMNSAHAEFYIVTTDKIGMKTISIYTFTEKPKPAPVEYITKAELIEILKGLKNESNSTKAESCGTAAAGGRPANHQGKS